MLVKEFEATIVDKERRSRWIFGVTYRVVLNIPVFQQTIHTRKCSDEQYYLCSIGDNITVTMYSIDGEWWDFTEKDARYRYERETGY